MRKLTLFSFGYYGWGNSTSKLVEAVDAIEATRGFEPPLFGDVLSVTRATSTMPSGGPSQEFFGTVKVTSASSHSL